MFRWQAAPGPEGSCNGAGQTLLHGEPGRTGFNDCYPVNNFIVKDLYLLRIEPKLLCLVFDTFNLGMYLLIFMVCTQ